MLMTKQKHDKDKSSYRRNDGSDRIYDSRYSSGYSSDSDHEMKKYP